MIQIDIYRNNNKNKAENNISSHTKIKEITTINNNIKIIGRIIL